MDFSKRLRLIGQKEEADRATALFRKGAEFHSFMKKPGDEDVLKPGGEEAPKTDEGETSGPAVSGKKPAADQLPASIKIPGTSKSSTNGVSSYNLTQTPPPSHDTDEDEEVKLTPVENSTVDDAEAHPLPYADYLIVSLPGQRNLKASAGKPYLIRGTPEQAIVDGKDFFKGINYVVMLDERALPQIKYYVSPLEVVGVISNDESRYSVSDFDTNLFGSKGPVKINALFVNYEHTTSLATMGVLLTDGFISPPDKTEFFGSKVAEVSQHKEQFPVSPELKGQIFDPVDKLNKEGKTNEAASQLSGLTESAFAMVSVEKKKEYIKTLTDAWTWESEE
jgi:hypothetical protein